DLSNPDITKQGDGVSVVQLKADRSRLASFRIARVFRHQVAVELYPDRIVTALDVERIPVVRNLKSGLGCYEIINTSRRILVRISVADLDLVPDMRRCP